MSGAQDEFVVSPAWEFCGPKYKYDFKNEFWFQAPMSTRRSPLQSPLRNRSAGRSPLQALGNLQNITNNQAASLAAKRLVFDASKPTTSAPQPQPAQPSRNVVVIAEPVAAMPGGMGHASRQPRAPSRAQRIPVPHKPAPAVAPVAAPAPAAPPAAAPAAPPAAQGLAPAPSARATRSRVPRDDTHDDSPKEGSLTVGVSSPVANRTRSAPNRIASTKGDQAPAASKGRKRARSTTECAGASLEVACLVKPAAVKVEELFNPAPDHVKAQPARVTRSRALLLTQPEEPQLCAKSRTRATRAKSKEEQESAKIAKSQADEGKHGSCSTHPTGDAVKGVIETAPFSLAMDTRAAAKHPEEQQDGRDFVFKAQPAADQPKRGQKSSKRGKPAITVPKSPTLRTRLRSHTQARKEQDAAQAGPSKGKNRDVAPGITVPEPFRLRTQVRGQRYEQEAKAQQEREAKTLKRKRNFKAHAVPAAVKKPAPIPATSSPHLTVPEPFCLRSLVGPIVTRHKSYRSKWQSELKEEERERKQKAQFKAAGMPAEDDIFIPHCSDKPITVPKDVNLATEARAEEREVFDEFVKERQQRIQEQRRRRQEELEREEGERAQAELESVKWKGATEVPDFSRPFCPRRSTRVLTVPASPKLAAAKRRRVK